MALTPDKIKRILTSGSKEEKDKAYDPTKQVEGYKKRMEASGLDPEKELDKRNFIGKFLNLDKDQNLLFDIFEILERPQQAVFGAIQASQKGRDVGKAAWEGLKGDEHVYGKDLLLNEGLVDDSGDKFGVDDLLGFALDVIADPIDIALIPATGGAKLVMDATQTVDAARTALKAAEMADSALDISRATKMLKSSEKALQASKKVKLNTLRRMAGRGVRAGASKAIGSVDNLTVSILKKLDDANFKKLGDVYTSAEGTVKRLRAVERYTDIKKGIKGVFNAAAALPKNTWNKVFKIRGAEMLSRAEMNILHKKLLKNVDEVAQKLGKSADDVGRDVMSYIEYFKYSPKGSYLNYIQNPAQALDQEAYEAVKPIFKATGFKIEDVYEEVGEVGSSGKVGYMVRADKDGRKMHKAFVKSITEDEEIVSSLGKLSHENWRKNFKAQVKSNYFSKMQKKGIELNNATKGSFITDVEKYLDDIFETGQPVDKILLRNKIYEIAEKNDLAKYVDDGTFKIDKLSNYLEKVTAERFTSLNYSSAETLLPRFIDPERSAYLQKMYGESEDFKNLTEVAYDTQTAMLETINKYFSHLIDDVPSNKMKFGMIEEGTIHHTESEKYSQLRKGTKLFPEYNDDPLLRGKRALFSERSYRASADEANAIYQTHIDNMLKNNALNDEQMTFFSNNENVKIFADTIQASLGDLVEQTPKLAGAVKMIDEVMATSWLYDENLIRPFKPYDEVLQAYQPLDVPFGYHKVNKQELISDLNSAKKYMEDGSAIEKLIEGLKSSRFADNDIIIERNIYSVVEAFTDRKTSKGFFKVMEWLNSLFKKTKLLSPGFQMRNLMGNTFNIWASGVPINQVMSRTAKAHTVLSKGDDVLKKVVDGVQLTQGELEIWKWYKPFLANGFDEVSKELFDVNYNKLVDDIAKSEGIVNKVKKPFRKVVKLNSDANSYLDKRYRMALFMYANENPELLSKFSVDDPASLVRKILFDPNDLSWAEKEHMRRFIPFYTFTKKNLVYQWENFSKSSRRYQGVQRAIRDTWKSMDLEIGTDVEQYKIEDFWIPIPKLGKDGKYTALKAKLPIEDLGEMIDNPLRKFVAASAPLVRAPYEYAANKQLFTQMTIQEFDGQRGYMIPEISRKAEYLLGQTGLDIPAAGLMDIGRTGVNVAKGEVQGAGDIFNQSLGRSVAKQGSAERSRTTAAYRELDEIRSLMKYYNQEGIAIMKIADIENKSPLNSLLARLKQINNMYR